MGGLARKVKRAYDDVIVIEPEASVKEYKNAIAAGPKKEDNIKPKPLLVGQGQAFGNAGNKKLPHEYVTQFRWSETAFGSTSNVERLKEDVVSTLIRTEDELKSNIQQFNEAKANVVAYNRKVNGNLMVRPISQFVNPKDIQYTSHLTTLIIAVPRAKEDDFLAQYEQVESNYLQKQLDEAAKRQAIEAKERAELQQKEQSLGKQQAQKPEEEEEHPGAAAAAAAAAPAVSQPEAIKIVYRPDPQVGLTTDDKYKSLPTVVPGSAIKIVGEKQIPGDEFSLFRVVCFKRLTTEEQATYQHLQSLLSQGVELTPQQEAQLKTSANVEKWKAMIRDYRWSIRPFVYDANEQQNLETELQNIITQRRQTWETLVSWAEESFDNVFRAWIHTVAMRVFVEIRLRYGLGNNWLSFVVEPKKNADKKVRDVLANLYTVQGTEAMLGASEDGEYYPYVSVTIDLADF